LTEYANANAGTTTADDGDVTMESWLQSSVEFRTFRKGEVVEGTVMGVQRDGVIVDLNAKSEGIIHLNEMHSMGADPLSKISIGDKILVYVMQPEPDDGQIVLSVDRARGERGWRVLQTRYEEGEAFESEVTGFNKGGLLVNVEGVHAFVPLSQVVGVRPEQEGEGGLASAVGKKLRLKVIEINRRRNRVILSERAALQEWRSQQKDRLLSELREGEIRKGKVSSVRSFGVFVDLGGADGLAHLSEVSWDRNRSPEDMYKIGDEVDVFIMKVDPETKKIALSLRRAQPEAWDEIVDKYQVGRVVAGMVTKLVTFGAFARIEGPVEGLIHVSELVDRRISHPKEVVREGDLLPLKIVRIERDRHRLGLSLRDAREDGERMGFRFSDAGEVIEVPDELRKEFEEREGVVVGTRIGNMPAPMISDDMRNGSEVDAAAPADEAAAATADAAADSGDAAASAEETVASDASSEEMAENSAEPVQETAENSAEPVNEETP
jgi:small subunit ribosomal protein S1